MKNKKGFELAMSTLVVIILALVILTVLILSFTGGWQKFWGTLQNFFISDVESVKKACESACLSGLEHDFCCRQRTVNLGNGKVNLICNDERLKIECEINCQNEC